MENFYDFLPFSEEVREAFENYNIEAAPLTVSVLPSEIGSLVGRVIWRSPLLKIGKQKNTDAVHLTLMDSNNVEITGTAWGPIAVKFNEVLEKGKIYKFSNVVPLKKTVKEEVKNDPFESRVIYQSIELRFSGAALPVPVNQDPYPDIDQSQFRSDYENIKQYEVAAVVGLVTAQFIHENETYICLSNGAGHCIGVSFGQDKLAELEVMRLLARHTVLGILGVGKLRDVNTETTGNKSPRALYKTFNDTILMEQPLCEASRNLEIWRDMNPLDEAEIEQRKQAL